MDPVPARDLTPLEAAIRSFNAGEDPSAGVLQRAFLAGRVRVLSASEIPTDGTLDGARLFGLGGAEGEGYLVVFTDEDRVPEDVGRAHPWMLVTSGESALGLTTQGITVNPGSDPTLAVAVKSAGVEDMRALARARHATADARAARAPHELESAIAATGVDGITGVEILRFAATLWPAAVVVPSSRPLEGPIDLDACYTFGPDDGRLLAVFTDRDQLGEFTAAHVLETTGGELVHRLPDGASLIINPQRPDQLALSAEGLRLMATMAERPMPPDPGAGAPTPEPPTSGAPAAEEGRRRGLFGRRRA
ncbi:hypothetical protein GCM10009840_12930 [Pseudolysinimonas kribbensis]|uniref:SseB protein N-terminal domain-containing protein n=1 Tax=Pseudolysinimonas kribbensis TaxID=433641 RepID=A0ABQ6K5U0_9MICO|nr:SseB family protein [Pseudolysinimonas kribbensis]GMA95744.1 hypothetical protein GCM10025881_25680 [Pseudolysinimonas kribbensis]